MTTGTLAAIIVSVGLGAIPGLLVLSGRLLVPPDKEAQFVSVSWVLVLFVALTLLASRRIVCRLPLWVVILGAIGFLIGFVIELNRYTELQDLCLIKPTEEKHKGYKNGEPLYFPPELDGNIAARVRDANGSRKDAIREHGPKNIDVALDQMPGIEEARRRTTGQLFRMFLYLSLFLVLAVGVIVFRLTAPAPSGNKRNSKRVIADVPTDSPKDETGTVARTNPFATLPLNELEEQLQGVITSAFTNENLEQFMLHKMQMRLWEEIDKGPTKTVVFHLFDWLRQRERLDEFLGKIVAARPDHRDLQQLADALLKARAAKPMNGQTDQPT